jgi:hypothetical protein
MLTGCAFSTGPVRYPDTWAPIESVSTADGCPNLDGAYNNFGVESFPAESGAPPKLSEVFARMGRGTGLMSPKETGNVWPEMADATSVLIRQTPEAINFTFVGDKSENTTLIFRRYHFNWFEKRYDDLFTCYRNESGARIRFFAEPENHSVYLPNLYLEGGGTLVFLLKASDGSLVVQWRGESFAIPPFFSAATCVSTAFGGGSRGGATLDEISPQTL